MMGGRGSATVDGGAKDGNIDFKGDIDFWEFEATAGESYSIEVTVPKKRRLRLSIKGYLFGLYFDDPRYDPGPGARENNGTALHDFEVKGNVVSGLGLQNGSEDNLDRAFVTGQNIRFEFDATETGTYFFGVRTPKESNGNSRPTGPYQVEVSSLSN